MLMQESIKEVINIHKCKFFLFLILCGLAGRPARAAGCRLARAGPAHTGLRAHYSGPPRVFSAGPRARP